MRELSSGPDNRGSESVRFLLLSLSLSLSLSPPTPGVLKHGLLRTYNKLLTVPASLCRYYGKPEWKLLRESVSVSGSGDVMRVNTCAVCF